MVKYMLKNETYAGTKHFNAWKYVQNEVSGKMKKIQRDCSEWIAVTSPRSSLVPSSRKCRHAWR